jgi:cytochrome c553
VKAGVVWLDRNAGSLSDVVGSVTTKVANVGFVVVVLGASQVAAYAGDVKAGAALAEKCQACHGLDGLSKIVEAPNIAGQNEQYLIEQLTAFKTGERHNEMMAIVAPTLSDKDIEDLASYYSAIEITVGKIPGK